MKTQNPDYFFYGLFFLTSLLVLWNLLLPGYILTLDMIFVDKIQLSEHLYGVKNPISSSIPFKILISALNKIFPMWLIQKIVLLSILFFSGVFAYQLCPTNKIGKFFAGLIYMINPFTFVRFLAGHLLLLIGYMFLPPLIKSLIEFFKEPTKKNIIKTTLALTSVSIFLNHFIPVIFGIFFLFLLFNLLKKKNRIKPFFIVLITHFILNSYWIFPLITSPKSHLRTMQEWIGPEDVTAFASKTAFDFNIIFNLASMHGFWRTGYDYAKFHIPFWHLLFFLIIFLSVHGFLTFYKDKKYGIYVKAFVMIFTVSLLLAAGITYKPTASLFNFLFENVPFFRGFREPQKFVALLVLTYSFLGGIGLSSFVNHLKTSKLSAPLVFLIMLSLAAPFIYSYTMFFGFHGQLETVWYPQTWYEANNYLSSDKEEFNVLFLPWHAYMDFRFNPKQRIGNPSEGFFSKSIIKGDNAEVGPIYSQSTNPISKYIEFLLFNNEKYDNFGELIKPLNIRYIILAKEVDWNNYLFLKNQTDLEIIMENPDLIVFKNKAETAKIYETDEVINATNWEELLSKKTIQKIEPIEYTKKSSVEYILKESPTKKYIIFTERFSEDWIYNNQKPMSNLGLTNTFTSSDAEKIHFIKFKYCLLGYIISGLTFLGIILYYFNNKIQRIIRRPCQE